MNSRFHEVVHIDFTNYENAASRSSLRQTAADERGIGQVDEVTSVL